MTIEKPREMKREAGELIEGTILIATYNRAVQNVEEKRI